jgi:hypothetical protein
MKPAAIVVIFICIILVLLASYKAQRAKDKYYDLQLRVPVMIKKAWVSGFETADTLYLRTCFTPEQKDSIIVELIKNIYE